MTTPNDYDLVLEAMNKIEEIVTTCFSQAQVPLPSRRTWSINESVVDPCEQVCYVYEQLNRGVPTEDPNELIRCNAMRTLSVKVEIWRCWPKAKDPRMSVDPVKSKEAVKIAMIDSWVLLDVSEALAAYYTGATGFVETQPVGEYAPTILSATFAV